MGFFTILSYVPIALYAESLLFHRALASAAISSFTIPSPLTGCVKDLNEIWELRPSDLLCGRHRSVVASLRHGNHFPLVNQALLDLAAITGRHRYVEDDEILARPVTVCISFITPVESKERHVLLRIAYGLAITVEVVALTVSCSFLFVFGLYVGGMLLICLLINVLLLTLLQWLTSPIFSRQPEIEKDRKVGAKGGAAVDVHVIVEHWNASRMDVLVGYSSHLHSLTNVPIRIKNWRAVRWITKALAVVLVVQAATLTSQISSDDVQVVGTAIWMLAYFVMWIPPRLVTSKYPDTLLRHQPATVHRLDQIVFSNRRVALTFIATLPWTKKAALWDWLDGFIPPGARRRAWEEEMEKGLLCEDEDKDKGFVFSNAAKSLISEVKNARAEPKFVEAVARFEEIVNMREEEAPDEGDSVAEDVPDKKEDG